MKRIALVLLLCCGSVADAAWIYPGSSGGVTTPTGTNVINILISARIGPGNLGQIALFGTTTTNVTNSVLFQYETNSIQMFPGYLGTRVFSRSATNEIYGNYTSATDFHRFAVVAGTGTSDFDELHGVTGSGNTSGPAGVPGVPPLKLQNAVIIESITPQNGHAVGAMYPATDSAQANGSTTLKWDGVYSDANGFQASPSTSGNFGAISGWKLGMNSTYISVRDNSANEIMRFGPNASGTAVGLDIGASHYIMGGASFGNAVTYLYMPTPIFTDAWIVLGTNNPTTSAAAVTLVSATVGSGTDSPGGKLLLSGGPSTGTGKAGATVLMTGTNAASTSSTPNSLQNRLYIEGHAVTLTESTATLCFNVALTAKQNAGIRIFATTEADDGTDFQSVAEEFVIAAVNKGGTVTTAISASTPSATLTSSGTLTTTWTAVANGNGIDIKNNAVSSLTQTTLVTRWRADLDGNGPLNVTAQ